MTSSPVRRTAFGAVAATVLGLVAAVAPVQAASPSYAVVCSSSNVDVQRDQANTFTLSCLDTDGEAVDQYVVVTQPTKAQSFSVDSATGAVSYRPLANATGTDTFTFKGVRTGLAESPVTTAVLTIENERPTCGTVAPLTVKHDASVAVPLVCTDADGDPLQIQTGTTGAAHGTVAVVAGQAVYTPAPRYTGADSFTLVATDGALVSTPATVAVTVTNARPACTGGALRTVHDRTAAFAVSCTDADGDALTRSVVAKAQHGTVTVKGGTATYKPAAGYVGTDVFTLAATDGIQASAPVAFAVQVTNALPRCTGTTRLTARAASKAKKAKIAVKLTCADADRDALTISVAAKPKHGDLVRKGASWTYVADKGYKGKDSFSLKASDGVSASKPVKYSVTVKSAKKR
ncbi:Ig-like domain-containing protein [Nocardioides lianchengensis]|uniref:Tandem-95 repeat protein n=1 Tax=Nocardioides lianchengensis TaxID=1045774 RepID=A0A1G6PZH4_9ACTN|nr:Ig-like domain-containing protein [Nocardioides lianchengensis]NYG12037.1 hypothetical protein [Nocardioides lianchengensis]SDC85479.1 hypothetical protein SAMN05421872_104205 [Nocardioides lianchengensis]